MASPIPPYLRDGWASSRKKQTNLKKPKAHEKRVESAIGGRRQPGSGAFDEAKGDVCSQKLLVECKRTVKKSLSVQASWLTKISREARSEGKLPALSIEFEQDVVGAGTEATWIAVPLKVFERLLEESDE